MRWAAVITTALAAAAALLAPAASSRAEFPEYVDQDSGNTHKHSGICTYDDLVVWDTTFTMLVSGCPLAVWPPPQPTYEEIGFAFMECYGGGMIDELLTIGGGGLDPASLTSASQWDEKSWWGTYDSASGGKAESYYNLHYSGQAGGATVYRLDEAAEYARENDYRGPVAPDDEDDVYEHPQYKFTHLLMDRTDVTLHRTNINGSTPDNYLAVIWGGSEMHSANYNSTNRIYTDLKARGYSDDEIYLCYPGGGGSASWQVDDGTNFQDMIDAWAWVHANANATTQIYFWSSICHGDKYPDLLGMIVDDIGGDIECGTPYGFDLDPGFVDEIRELFYFYGGGDGTGDGQPYFQVITAQPAPDLVVVLNGKALPLLATGDISYGQVGEFVQMYALDETDMLDLGPTGNTVLFDCGGAVVDFVAAGPTTGGMANGIPEPACAVLLILGICVIRRKR